MAKMKMWSRGEVIELTSMYSVLSPSDCAKRLGRTVRSVINKALEQGLSSPFNRAGRKRRFYAEDVAKMFELKNTGLDNHEIGLFFNVSRGIISTTISKAKKQGFDRFPKREL